MGALIVDAIVIAPVLIPLEVFFGELNGGALLVYAALGLGYFHILESVNGQTLGKRLFDLRVVRAEDAGPASAKAISARTVLRLIDGLPGAYVVGGVTMLLTGKRRQRIGDLAARTAVTRASARPFTPARRSPLQTLYPSIWLGAALAVVLVMGHGGDAELGRIDGLCKQAQALEADLGPAPPPERYYAIRSVLIQRVSAMTAHSRRTLEAGRALIEGTLQEIDMVRQGQYAAAAALARNHHQELADRGLGHC